MAHGKKEASPKVKERVFGGVMNWAGWGSRIYTPVTAFSLCWLTAEVEANMEGRAWVLGSIVKELIVFLEHLLYVTLSPRCLICTALFSPHNNPGQQIQFSSLRDEGRNWSLRVKAGAWIWSVNFMDRLPHHTGLGRKGGWKEVRVSWFCLGLRICHSSLPPNTPTSPGRGAAAASPGLDMALRTWVGQGWGGLLVVPGYRSWPPLPAVGTRPGSPSG